MKKMMFTLIAMLTIAASANAMSYEQARNEALFLTDKMAYELNLSDAQYEAAYEINLDYLMGVTSQYDVFGPYWERRNLDLSYILFSWQWDLFRAATYFYRPLVFEAGYWHFSVYARYPHRDYFYFGRPHFYSSYRGGHSWRMNGGRSFYEGRRDYYRPGNPSRDHHFGMRSGWDRGDYHGNPGRHSSTHVTGGNGHHQPTGGRDGHGGGYSIGGSRSGSHPGGFGSTRNGNVGNDHHPTGGNHSVDGNRPTGGNHSMDGNRPTGGSRSSGGSFNNNRPSSSGSSGSHSSGSIGSGSRNGGSMSGSRSGGSIGGGSRSGGSVGGGSRSNGSGSTRSGGSSVGGGSRSGGGSSNSHGNFGGGRH